MQCGFNEKSELAWLVLVFFFVQFSALLVAAGGELGVVSVGLIFLNNSPAAPTGKEDELFTVVL